MLAVLRIKEGIGDVSILISLASKAMKAFFLALREPRPRGDDVHSLRTLRRPGKDVGSRYNKKRGNGKNRT